MNYKKLLFDDCVRDVLREYWHMAPLLNHDALPHKMDHLEGILHIHNTEDESIPYIMQADGSVIYLTFDDSETDFIELKNKQVILIGKWSSTKDVFNVQDIRED